MSALRKPIANQRGRGSRRGIALLMVLTTLVFLVVLVTEIAYSSRVRFLKSAHARDDIAAEYLAMSGVSIYRLILVANKQMGDSSIGEMASSFGISEGLWQMVPAINTGLLRMFFVSGGSVDDQELEQFATEGLTEEEVAESRFADKGFLDFEGDFSAEVNDEDRKINIRFLGKTCDGTCTLATLQEDPVAIQLYGLMSGQEHDQWFYEKDIERWEIIADLADWIDTDTDRIWRGGYEDSLYNSLDSPYLAKNAPFDTKDEIRLVNGWQDDIYEKFGDEVTIYGPGKVNVNTASDEMLKGLFKAYVERQISDDEADQFLLSLREQTMIVDFTKPKEFVEWLETRANSPLRDGLSDAIKMESETFRVDSTGMVGNSTATISVVLDFSSSKVGRIKYWRVD